MKRKLLNLFVALVLAVSLCLVMALPASANVTPTAATGGDAISADDFGTGDWTTLTGPIIAEANAAEIGTGTIVFNAPAGFEFNTTENATAAVTGNVTQLTLASLTVAPTATTITFTVATASSGNLSTIAFSNIQVRPTAGTPLATENITTTGSTSAIAGVTHGTTNFGTLTMVAGDSDHLIVETANAGIEESGVAFTLTLTIEDQFGNTVDDDAAHNMIYDSDATAAPDGTGPTIPGSEDALNFAGGVAATSIAEFTLVNVTETPTISVSDNSTEPILGESDPIFVEGINLDSAFYDASGDVTVWVCDDSENGDPMALETVNVSANSTTDNVGDTTITLTETNANTSIFRGSFTLIPLPPADREANQIVVTEGDEITVSATEGGWVVTADIDTTGPVFAETDPVVADEDYYSNGDTIELTVDLDAAGYTITADFLVIDSEYTAGDETVTDDGGGVYIVTYALNADNTIADGSYAITVTAEDDAENSATDDSCSVSLDNTEPSVTAPTATPSIIQPDDPTDVTFTVTVADSGAGMSETVTPVTANLTAIGGVVDQQMYDDETNGDDTADDGIYTYLLSGLNVAAEDEGTYYLVITATDNVSNVNATANVTLRVIADNTAPVSDASVEYPAGFDAAKVGQDVIITAVVTDDLTDVASVTIDAADIGLTASENLTLTETANTYSVTLTVGEVDPDTYTLTITAEDGAGNPATENVTVEVVAELTAYNLDLEEGWNLISLPLIPDDEDIATILADITDNVSQVRTFLYESGGLVEYVWMEGGLVGALDEMVDGQGYWIEMTLAKTLVINGSEQPSPGGAMPAYDVYEGWNLIGFKSVGTDTATDYLGSVVDTMQRLYGYNAVGDYYITLQDDDGDLEPGQGYWLAVSADGTIYP